MERPSDQAARNLQALVDHRLRHAGRHHAVMQRLRDIHFPSARDDLFGTHLETCLGALSRKTEDGNRSEAEGILLLGRSGAGKSDLVEVNVRRHTLFGGFMRDEGCAAVGIRCAGSFTLKVLAVEILRRTGYPIKDIRESIAWLEVRRRLRHLGIMLLVIDEAHHILKRPNAFELFRVTMSIKALLNDADWPLVVILTGVPSCEEHVQSDRELARRLRTMTLDDLTREDLPVIRRHVAYLCREAGLAVEDGTLREIVPRLVHAASAAFGWTIKLALDSIEAALNADATSIEIEHFASAYAARNQVAGDHNPFVAPNWTKVVSMPIAPYVEHADGTAAAPSSIRSHQGLR